MVAAILSAVVGALVGATLSPVTNSVMVQILKLVEKDQELWASFKKDMGSLRKDLRMVVAAAEDKLSGKRHLSAVTRISMEDMRELSYDIQDCMDRILCYSECGRNIGRRNFAEEITTLKQRLKDALEWQKSNIVSDSQLLIPKEETQQSCKTKVVGIDEPMRELRNVLEGHPEKLSVISIVGFSGLGKTTLAQAVYNCYDGDADADRFDARAWVVASKCKDDARLLMALQEELSKNDRHGLSKRRKDPHGCDVQRDITLLLKNKRYLIVLDDIDQRQWDNIKSTFPTEKRSRIIVTTTSQVVAKFCCKHGTNGYVYNMRPLGKRHSKELLEDILKDPLPGFDKHSDLVIEKFDGHPLSLVSVAKYLLTKDEFPENFWNIIGVHMSREEYPFTKLQQVLIENFSSLQGHHVNLKILLLYICVFQNTHPIRRSRLIRRWLAEGYVQDPDPCKALQDADENLKELIDLNIIRPINPSKNAEPKTCRAHGIMHEFLLSFARSIKFITDLGSPRRGNYRHLFLEGKPSIGGGSNADGTSSDEREESRAHSLTICGSAGEAVGYLPKCELLRVLDLEECQTLEDEHTSDIHKLWHLKYLSLGGSIKKVPSNIEKMHSLETLDMRKTKIETLPVEVIKLPHLAHLLGKFKLEKRDWENNNADNFLPPESNLQTLAGFLTDDNPGFPKLMVHMKQLNKVQILCNSVGNQDSLCLAALLTAMKLFVQSRLDTCRGDHSLSLDLGNSSEDILNPLFDSIQLSSDRSSENLLEIPCAYLSSLKLHGALRGLTQNITLVGGLRELCLSSTNGLTPNELSNLCKLIDLVYLKLIGVSLGGFIIKSGDFRELRRLCLVQCEGLPEIKNGALTYLLSLRILNKNPGSLSGIEIKNHIHLQEIGLDSEVNQVTKTDLENAAKEHPKRPVVLFFKKSVVTDGTGSMVKYVAAEKPSHMISPAMQVEPHISNVHSMVEEETKPAAQVNSSEISSNSQNPNSGGELRAEDQGKMKQSNHDTGDENEGKGKNDKNYKISAEEKGKLAVVDGYNSAENSPGKGNGKVDNIKLVKKDRELSLKSQLGDHCIGDHDHAMINAN